MIDLRLLDQLATFASLGTLSAAAEKLHTSQPALSRSMKQLEEELGVALFSRTKNHLTLTETGQKAAEYAAQVLAASQDFEAKVKAFDRSLHTLSIGYCAPIPQAVLTPIISACFSGMTLAFDMTDDVGFLDLLDQGVYQLCVVHEAPADEKYLCKKCGHEDLYIAVVPQHPLAAKKELRLSDLDGLSLLLLHDIGFWHNMHQSKTPHTRYLHQHDRTAFTDIAIHSPYPIFASGYQIKRGEGPAGRVCIPIVDPEAHTDYYLVCLRADQDKYTDLFRQVSASTID